SCKTRSTLRKAWIREGEDGKTTPRSGAGFRGLIKWVKHGMRIGAMRAKKKKTEHHLGTNDLGPNVDPPRCSVFYGESSYSPGNEAISHPLLPFYSTLPLQSVNLLPMGLRSFLKNTKSSMMGSYGDNHTMLLLYKPVRLPLHPQ
ncbi:hypothetical protein FOC4_g10012758, partial [Fusarium odoratissimum]